MAFERRRKFFCSSRYVYGGKCIFVGLFFFRGFDFTCTIFFF
jgi:hypothetical protein